MPCTGKNMKIFNHITNHFSLSPKTQRFFAMMSTTVFLRCSVACEHSSTFSLPLDPVILVRRTEGNSLEELRLIEIHLELIPERAKRVPILQGEDKCLFSRAWKSTKLKSCSVTGGKGRNAAVCHESAPQEGLEQLKET